VTFAGGAVSAIEEHQSNTDPANPGVSDY